MAVVWALILSACASPKLKSSSSISIDEVYFQEWRSGVEGGGSGLNLFITLSEPTRKSIQLDSVYFRERSAKLESIRKDSTHFVGRFTYNSGLQLPFEVGDQNTNEQSSESTNIPFELQNNACVISYFEEGNIKYVTLDSIAEKRIQNYPTAPTNQQ